MDLLQSDAFRKHAELLMDAYRLPGLSISISQDNIYFRSDWMLRTSILQQNVHPTLCTTSPLAPNRLQRPATCVALLVEDDEDRPEVHWDTPLHDLLPEDFVMPTPELNDNITIVDVLSRRT